MYSRFGRIYARSNAPFQEAGDIRAAKKVLTVSDINGYIIKE